MCVCVCVCACACVCAGARVCGGGHACYICINNENLIIVFLSNE